MARSSKSLTNGEKYSAVIPPFSILDNTLEISQVCQEASKECSIAEHFIEDIYPCSPTQEGLLASSMKDPGASILQFVYQMPESVDLDKLIAAWETVAKRTQVLRTRFFYYNSDLLQVVVNEPSKWEVIDGDLDVLLTTERGRKMNLGEGMSRQIVLRQRDSLQYHLVWTIHHALLDGWSESDIVTAVEQEYLGHSQAISTAPVFNDFIKHIGQQDKVSSQEYWRQQLTGAPIPVFPPLPDPSYIPKVQRSNGIFHHPTSHIEAELEHTVPFFKEDSAMASTMIQAAWFLLIGMYSNTSDVVTGLTLNGHTAQLRDMDLIPGPTIPTVPFRMRYTPDQKVSDLLQTIQNQYHNILPFAHFGLRNIRRLSEDAAGACKFRSLLAVQSANRPKITRQLLLGRGYSLPVLDFAIVMECELSNGGVDFRATFDHQVLSEAQVRRMFQQMEDILLRISLSGPSTRVSDLQKISQADMLQIFQWNALADPKTAWSCVHELIQQQGREHRNTPAISAWDGELSYDTLDQYSSRLAAHLQLHYGVGPESLVTICFEKSLWAVVSMLSVLKAGGACVPVDPDDSNGRLRTIICRLGENNANLVLTSSTNTERLRELGIRVLAVEAEMIDSLVDVGSVSSKVTPANAAFVSFTSGSRGIPRGTVLEHQAFCSGTLAWGHSIQRSDRSRVFQYLAYTSHISLGDIFSTLIYGGCICIPSEHDRMNNLSTSIESLNANHLSLTPTVAGYIRPEDLPSVEVLVTVGETITKQVIETWADRVTLINMYGSVECTMYCTGKIGTQRHEHYSNIGRGIGALTWIVSPEDANSLTPIGGVGELLIEGPILARGYLGDESQTKANFIEDPAWSKYNDCNAKRRFYKTGDFASYNSDGSLAFVGRNGSQVELRGQRIEVAEVENRLREIIPLPTGVAVTVVYPKNGYKMLAAFLVVGGENEENTTDTILASSPSALEQFPDLVEEVETRLCSILPSYMVPSLYIPIRTLPLSASAKLDRNALQHLASKFSLSELFSLREYNTTMRSFKPPSTRMERRIHDFCKTLLNTDQIGIDDNFFDLGGNSVLAMRLVSMARREGMTLTVNGIFKSSTLRDLALTVRENVSTADLAPFALVRSLDVADLCRQTALQCGIRAEEIEDIYPCSAMQLHYVTGYPEAKKNLSDPWHWQSQVVYSLPQSIDLEKFRAVWNSAVRRHPTLRTRLINTSSGMFQAVLKASEPPKWNESNDLERYMEEDKSDNMTFGDRLLRLATVESKDTNERFFIMTIHHSTYDAFSLSMLFKELETAYFQGLPDLPLPKMNHFIKYITESDKAAATDFWISYLADAVTKPLLAAPKECTAINPIEKNMVMDIPKLHRSECTLATMIEVAYGLAVAQKLGCPDVILYSDRSGRNLPVEGIQDLIGPTTLFLPVRIHIDARQKVQDLLRESQSFQKAKTPFEHLGWLELREMSHLKPVLQNSVNMNIIPRRVASLGEGLGLELKSAYASCDDPFGINVNLYDGQMVWQVFYDERFITDERVEMLMKDIERIFFQLADAFLQPEITVGEILELSRNGIESDAKTRTGQDKLNHFRA